MSLLIKALQKAERSKNAAATGDTPTDAPADVPVPGVAEQPLTLPPDILDEDIHALTAESGFDDIVPEIGAPISSTRIETPPPPRKPQATPQAAANVFQAKQDGSPRSSQRPLWLALSGAIVLMLAGAGFYFYLESLQPAGDLVIPRPLHTASATLPNPPSPAASTEPVPENKAEPTQEATSAVPSQPIALPQASSVTEVAAPIVKPEPQQEHATAKPPTADVLPANTGDAEASAPHPKPKATSKPKAPRDPVSRSARIKRAEAKASPTDAMSAYQAYMAGDDAEAERLYRQALRLEPRNADVLLGLAAVAARQGRVEEAEQHYLHVLELEPRNVAAQAGLIGLVGLADASKSESRLKGLIAQQADAAFLHEALGNLYSDQGQWGNAQQAYFQAFHLEPANAEYAFNLAVSLDQLGKAALALDYYQRAQSLATSGNALDKAQLERRITQLRQMLGR